MKQVQANSLFPFSACARNSLYFPLSALDLCNRGMYCTRRTAIGMCNKLDDTGYMLHVDDLVAGQRVEEVCVNSCAAL
jgi:hypothetical protein